MQKYLRIAAVVMAACGAASSAQIQRPVQSVAVVRQAITGDQTRQLANVLAQRETAKQVHVDPRAFTAIARSQTDPVTVDHSQVVAVAPTAPPPSLPTTVEFVRTTAQDEVLLRGALAANVALRPALTSTYSSLITLPGLVRMTNPGGDPLQLKPFILVNAPLQRDMSHDGMFVGELLIGVAEIVDSPVVKPLPVPLLFQIVGAEQSDPADVRVSSTSPPFQRVKVWLRQAADRTGATTGQLKARRGSPHRPASTARDLRRGAVAARSRPRAGKQVRSLHIFLPR